MKVNIEIDLQELTDDLINDGEGDLVSELKHQIIREAVGSVKQQLKPDLRDEIAKTVLAQVSNHIDVMVSDTVDRIIREGSIETNKGVVKITDYVKDAVKNNHGWRNPHDHLVNFAKEFGAELKTQYNNHFAMNIIKNLSEQGLLNEDVAKALLAPPKS